MKEASHRSCALTRESLPRSELIRFAIAPDGRVVPDVAEKLPGRGIWLKSDRSTVEEAVKKTIFNRAAKQKVTVEADLGDRIAELLTQRCIGWLQRARASGFLVLGREKMATALERGEIELIVSPEDGELAQKVDWQDAPVLVFGHRRQLAEALGRADVVHAGMKKSGITGRFIADVKRLAGFKL